MCAHRRLRSAWASAQSDMSLRSEGSWGPKLSSCEQRRLWSDWADAQADLSVRWAHMPFCWFCHEASHLLMIREEINGYGRSYNFLNIASNDCYFHHYPQYQARGFRIFQSADICQVQTWTKANLLSMHIKKVKFFSQSWRLRMKDKAYWIGKDATEKQSHTTLIDDPRRTSIWCKWIFWYAKSTFELLFHFVRCL